MLKHEKRFLATLIDIGIVLILSFAVYLFLPHFSFLNEYLFVLLYFVIGFIYTFLSLFLTRGYTIGLSSLSLKLLDKDWERVSKRNIVIRALSQAVPIMYLVNILYMLLNKTDVTFFDELTHSMVVNTGTNVSAEVNLLHDDRDRD